MTRITVVGLGGRTPEDDWDTFAGALVVARSEVTARACLPPEIAVDLSFGELFDAADITTVADAIVRDLTGFLAQQDVVYLTPGVALIGDLTVERLIEIVDDVVLIPGEHLLGAGGDGRLQIVDALVLAQAEQREPFGGGVCPLNSTTALVVTNWHGSTVTRLAEQRLRRQGYQGSIVADEDGNLYLPPTGMLEAMQSFAALQHVYARLRRPDGCPWDREQTELSTVPHIVEEADELREAFERLDWAHAAEELGDVLGNVLMIAQIAHEHGHFDFEDVLASISAKLVRRHPHVFGDAHASDADEVLAIWQQVKAVERGQRPLPPVKHDAEHAPAGASHSKQGQGQA